MMGATSQRNTLIVSRAAQGAPMMAHNKGHRAREGRKRVSNGRAMD
jgi:hypothetical protein